MGEISWAPRHLSVVHAAGPELVRAVRERAQALGPVSEVLMLAGDRLPDLAATDAMMRSVMSEAGVFEVLDGLERTGLTAWVDGGWGIDALIGETTRTHSDLDLVVMLSQVDAVRAVLRGLGYDDLLRDWLPVAVAIADGQGREIDLHPITPVPVGGGTQALPDGESFYYPAPVHGKLGDRSVSCVDAETQVRCHLGYEPSEKDRLDMHRLHAATGVDLPSPFRAD
jgi:lincosamide nucleotidyltransferase A/C/D/E